MGLCLVSSMISLQLTSVHLLCHQHEHGRHFGITFLSFYAIKTVFQMYKGDISWNCTSILSARARENVPCLIAITIAMGINSRAPGSSF